MFFLADREDLLLGFSSSTWSIAWSIKAEAAITSLPERISFAALRVFVHHQARGHLSSRRC